MASSPEDAEITVRTSLIGLHHIFLRDNDNAIGDRWRYELRGTILLTGVDDILRIDGTLRTSHGYPQYIVEAGSTREIAYDPIFWNTPLPCPGAIGAEYLSRVLFSLTTESVADVLSPEGNVPERFRMSQSGELLRLTDHLAGRGERTIVCVHPTWPARLGGSEKFYYFGG